MKPACPKKVIKLCKLKKVNIEELKKEIKQTVDYSDTVNELISLVNYYNDELSKIFDKHAPEVEKEIAFRKLTPRTSKDVKPEKR